MLQQVESTSLVMMRFTPQYRGKIKATGSSVSMRAGLEGKKARDKEVRDTLRQFGCIAFISILSGGEVF